MDVKAAVLAAYINFHLSRVGLVQFSLQIVLWGCINCQKNYIHATTLGKCVPMVVVIGTLHLLSSQQCETLREETQVLLFPLFIK